MLKAKVEETIFTEGRGEREEDRNPRIDSEATNVGV
jgi:hypothetical protein